MDGELGAEPTRFLLRRLDHDPELSATWSRWHLIRDCLAAEPARMSTRKRDDDFAAQVATTLGAGRDARTHTRHWAQYIGGSALAASVAVAALILYTPNAARNGGPAPDTQRTAAAPVSTAAAPTLAAVPAKAPVTPPWLNSNQSPALNTQPAAADVVYGTGLMQPDYLRNAAYGQGAAIATFSPPLPVFERRRAAAPFAIVPWLGPVSSASAAQH
jgi:sigma-E factor negative regulatory protein RseA